MATALANSFFRATIRYAAVNLLLKHQRHFTEEAGAIVLRLPFLGCAAVHSLYGV
jgi:hypothetical protein